MTVSITNVHSQQQGTTVRCQKDTVRPLPPRDFWMTHLDKRLRVVDCTTTFSSDYAVQNAEALLDAEIDALERAKLAAKTRRNALSRVSRLLPDVLPLVFAMLIPDEPPIAMSQAAYGTVEQQRMQTLGWTKVTQVCRAWREAALSEPSLWATITRFASPQWMLASLARSKRAPLALSLDVSQMTDDLLREALGPGNAPRLKHLCLIMRYFVHFGQWEKPLPGLNQPLPLLESLSIRTEWYPLPDLDPPVLPMLEYSPLALRKLVLVNCLPPSWDSPLLCNLTSLEVSLSQSVPHSSLLPAPLQLIDVLTQSPQMKILTLKHVLQQPDPKCPHPPVPGRTRLPHLSELNITDTANTLVHFLEGLELPSTTTVDIFSSGPIDDLVALVKLQTSRSNAPGSPARSLAMGPDIPKKRILRLQAYDEHQSGQKSRRPKLSFTLATTPEADARAWTSLAHAFCRNLHLDRVTSLTLSGPLLVYLSVRGLREMVTEFGVTRTTTLCLQGGDMDAILPLLLEGSPSGDMPSVWPELADVELHWAPIDCAQVRLPLLAALKARRDWGVPVSSLVLRSCTSVDAWRTELEEYVGQVLVDSIAIDRPSYTRMLEDEIFIP
ncbi:hypothetical protein DENSPDRAFT_228219 [Dentipellis sp. KUC8613]|nr:hypothetical protein DENSPDRAFT_228219 [Dentipellis sp. KUC8613]